MVAFAGLQQLISFFDSYSRIRGHKGGVYALQSHGDILVCSNCVQSFSMLKISGSSDKTIRVWKFSTGEFIRDLLSHSGTVYCLIMRGNALIRLFSFSFFLFLSLLRPLPFSLSLPFAFSRLPRSPSFPLPFIFRSCFRCPRSSYYHFL